MENMSLVLEMIVLKIQAVNNSRTDGTSISDDQTNEELVGIFHDVMNKFSDIDLELVDDEDVLAELFGQEGYCSIREAEQEKKI